MSRIFYFQSQKFALVYIDYMLCVFYLECADQCALTNTHAACLTDSYIYILMSPWKNVIFLFGIGGLVYYFSRIKIFVHAEDISRVELDDNWSELV